MIASALDRDFYDLTVGQLFFLKFSDLKAKYKFILRSSVEWPQDFWANVQQAVDLLSDLEFQNDELNFLANLNIFKPCYLDWLSKTCLLDSDLVNFEAGDDGKMELSISGPLFKAVYWEVPLLAIISELYHKQTTSNGFLPSPAKKVASFDELGVPWADFGTRRRYSRYYHSLIVDEAKRSKNFVGSSNLSLCMKHGLQPIGTMSHQGPQAMSGAYGIERANAAWGAEWMDLYKDKLSIFLPDTFTTDYCIKTYGDIMVWWDGVRQDSSNPIDFLEKILNLYKQYGVDATKKKIIFSDGLTPTKIAEIHTAVGGRIQDSYGCGTNLTNDVVAKPLNAVIKLIEIDNKPVVKLSDAPGKYTGSIEAIESARKIVGLMS